MDCSLTRTSMVIRGRRKTRWRGACLALLRFLLPQVSAHPTAPTGEWVHTLQLPQVSAYPTAQPGSCSWLLHWCSPAEGASSEALDSKITSALLSDSHTCPRRLKGKEHRLQCYLSRSGLIFTWHVDCKDCHLHSPYTHGGDRRNDNPMPQNKGTMQRLHFP